MSEPKDYSRLSCSRIVHYKPDEPPIDRHVRRLTAAQSMIGLVESWCEFRGVRFHRSCVGQHPHAEVWMFSVQLHQAAAIAVWHPALGQAHRIGKIVGKRRKDWVASVKDKLYDVDHLLLFLQDWYLSIPFPHA